MVAEAVAGMAAEGEGGCEEGRVPLILALLFTILQAA